MFAVITFLVVIAIVLTAARVGSVALEATGMARDSAQFQARSALLGVGFTTSEAEDITGHPTRRKIALWLMTFGNAGAITAIGSFVLTFGGTETAQTLQRSGLLLSAR
ncbi:MAG: potassium transporter TrkA, partial [Acidimicrobiia bacterium]|nr:potassium transporter TrkA [Acidimicrobiia bacterium]